ncbi:hypothetical protein [Nakamurella antarctica]|uniref:hypothetical protein n=1 Tax=Nakamurella antarctica TaxID=1902245 RepID=UPI0013DDBD58|nr:hypothetical protein [Nakamurella antarctica]
MVTATNDPAATDTTTGSTGEISTASAAGEKDHCTGGVAGAAGLEEVGVAGGVDDAVVVDDAEAVTDDAPGAVGRRAGTVAAEDAETLEVLASLESEPAVLGAD